MTRKKNSTWLFLLTLVVSIALVSLMGCESKSVLDDNANTPEGTSVTVAASPSSIESGTTSVVEATVVASSVGVPNQAVTFTVTPANAGYFTPAVDTTDANGVAASVFTATTTGSATVSCVLDDNTTSGFTAMTVTDVAQTGSGNVDMDVSKTLLLADGVSTSVVTINVRDANGAVAPDSTLVTIVAGEKFIDVDENGYWSAGIDSLVFDANSNGTWDAVGIIQSAAYLTGGTGSVSVNYTSGNDATTVYVKATVNDNGIVGNVELPIQLTPNASINSIYLASDSMNLVVKQTGGIETSMIHATGYDEFGNPVPEGLTINFIITDGPGGGEHLGSTGAGPYVAVTNSQGIASTPISSGTVSGTMRIRAYSDTVLSNATQIMVSSGPPAFIELAAEDCNVPNWHSVGEENIITAVVSDIYMNPVTDSTVVYFTTDEGVMKSHETRTTELEGIVSTIWFSANNAPGADGIVWIIAETSGGTVVDTAYFINSSFTSTIFSNNMPDSLTANGTDEVTVEVEGRDVNSNFVDEGIAFISKATYLSVGVGAFFDGCFSSHDWVEITSATLDVDESTPGGNDDGRGAIDYVRFRSGNAFISYPVILNTGHAYSGNSKVTAISSAAQGEVVYVSALIADRWENPLGDHTLNMTASGGVVAGASQETNGYGEANGFTWTAPAVAGEYTININDTDPRGSGLNLSAKITVE